MLASVASQHDVSPSGIVGLVVAASSVVGGLYASFRSRVGSLLGREKRLNEIMVEAGVPEDALLGLSLNISAERSVSILYPSESSSARYRGHERFEPIEGRRLETE